MILECHVLCYSKSDQEKKETFGFHDVRDIWLKAGIDLKTVVAIKQIGDEDGEPIEDQCSVYTATEHFIIDIDFEKVLDMWKTLQPKNIYL